MTLQGNLAAIPFAVAALISGTVGWLAWRRRSRPGGVALCVAMVGEMGWALFEGAELSIEDLPIKKICFALRVACATATILGLITFVLRYTGEEKWLSGWHFGAIVLPQLAFVLMAFTNEWHKQYWAGMRNGMFDKHWVAVPTYGPVFWYHLACFYMIALVACALLVRAMIRRTGVFRAQAAVMLFGISLPWVVNIVDMSRMVGYIYVDTAAMTFAITGLTLLPGLYRFRLLDLAPVAWATVVRDMEDPVVVIDPGGRVLELNPMAQALVGVSSADAMGQEVERVFGSWPELTKRLALMGYGALEQFELEWNPRSGEKQDYSNGTNQPVVYDVRISRLGEPVRPSGWVVVMREITERKRAEEERVRALAEQAALAEAEAANRAKDRFLAMLSHELRTPLTPVLATVTAMLDERTTPASLRHVLEMIRRNVVLEARLIDDLLDLTRIRGGKLDLELTVIDAHDSINRVVGMFLWPLQESGLVLKMNLAAARHHVEADADRLEQVLWNLLKNAIKFTSVGGVVTIRTRDLKPGEGLNDGSASVLVIEVSDTGIGIEPEVLPRIFDIFEQGGVSSTRRYGGLGLGLTISRSIVEAHGGRLTAFSEGRGRGASFCLMLSTVAAPAEIRPRNVDRQEQDTPAFHAFGASVQEREDLAGYRLGMDDFASDNDGIQSQEAVSELIEKLAGRTIAGRLATASLANPEIDLGERKPAIKEVGSSAVNGAAGEVGGERLNAENVQPRALQILLVEDNLDTLNYLTTILRNRGHDVCPASDLSTALRLAEQSSFDVLVSDIELPDGSGLELMWRLRSQGHVAGIAVSGFGSPEDVEMSRAAGFADHLTKPVDFRRLEAAIRRLSDARGILTIDR